MRGIHSSVFLVALAGAFAVPAATGAARPFDFDADGRDDIVMGLPDQSGDGAVAILHGAATGPPRAPTMLTPATPGAPVGVPFASDFGAAIASADFDGDGHADLAVSDPFAYSTETADRDITRGAVSVFRGTAGGVGTNRSVAFLGPELDAEFSAALFGYALAATDLDGDGFGDLIVGAPGDDPIDDGEGGNGAIRILFGSAAGLGETRTRRLRPQRLGEGMWSGSVLGIGDFDRDGHPDVISAEPGHHENSDLEGRPGHVAYCRGTADGPRRCDTRGKLMRNGLGPTSIAVGDVNGDGYEDAVLGMPFDRFENDDEPPPRGAVLVLRGSRSGLRNKPIVIKQETKGIPGRSDYEDRFGTAVAVSRVDADRYADIAVGAPGEDGGTGRVTVIRGGRHGHARRGHAVLDPGRLAPPAARRSRFGSALTLLDHDGDGRSDLMVSAPERTGSAHLFRGARSRFERATVRSFRMVDLGLSGRLEPRFGRTDGSCCVLEGGAY